MNIVIFGSRSLFPDTPTIFSAIKALGYLEGDIDSVISGMAIGVDTAALRFAEDFDKQIIKYPADWDKHGKTAGFIRNQQMCDIADVAVCFWDGKSKGTQDMIKRVIAKGIPLSIQVNTIKPTQVKEYKVVGA